MGRSERQSRTGSVNRSGTHETRAGTVFRYRRWCDATIDRTRGRLSVALESIEPRNREFKVHTYP